MDDCTEDLKNWDTASLPPEDTAKVLQEHGVNAVRTNKIEQAFSQPAGSDSWTSRSTWLLIHHPRVLIHSKDGFLIRRTCHRDWSQCTDRHGYRKSSGDQSGKHRHQEADIGRHCYRKKSGSEVKKYQGKRLKSCSCLHDKAFHLGTKLEESCRRAAFFCSDQRKCDKNVKKVDIIVSK